VEITGAHPGGDSSLIQSLEQMLEQSIKIKNKAKAGKYFVSVAFLLEGDGSVTDIRCVNDPGFGMCEQVVTVIKRNFPRKWGAQIDSSGKVRRYHTTFATLHDQ
jgi:hypothetical protein